MRKGPSKKQLRDHTRTIIRRDQSLARTVDRHFTGIITSLRQFSSSGIGPYFLVRISRLAGPDNNDYVCSVPGYFPFVGDDVECEWRDQGSVGYVKWPIFFASGTANPYKCAVYQNAGQTVGVGTSICNLTQTTYDFASQFNATAHTFTAKVSGYYLIFAQLGLTAAATGWSPALFVNGAQIKFGTDLTGKRGVVHTKYFLNAGDVLDLRLSNATGGNVTIDGTGVTVTYLEVSLQEL